MLLVVKSDVEIDRNRDESEKREKEKKRFTWFCLTVYPHNGKS